MVAWAKLAAGVAVSAFSLYWFCRPERVFRAQFRGPRWDGVENTEDVELDEFAVTKRRILALLLFGFSLVFALSAVL